MIMYRDTKPTQYEKITISYTAYALGARHVRNTVGSLEEVFASTKVMNYSKAEGEKCSGESPTIVKYN